MDNSVRLIEHSVDDRKCVQVQLRLDAENVRDGTRLLPRGRQ